MIIIIILIIKFICRRDVLLSVFPVGKTGFTGLADNNASLFLLRSEKMLFRISAHRPGPLRRINTICATPSAEISSICCVYPLPRDRPLSTVKGRCGYFPAVVHFRKVVIRQKVGSAGNGHPVI